MTNRTFRDATMPDLTRAPLKTAWFHILLALAEGAQHGFAIREITERRTDGALKLWPATLYGSIREMTEAGLIEPLEGEEGPDDDQRRRYYRLTRLGGDMLRSEADRLQELVNAARGSAALGRA